MNYQYQYVRCLVTYPHVRALDLDAACLIAIGLELDLEQLAQIELARATCQIVRHCQGANAPLEIVGKGARISSFGAALRDQRADQCQSILDAMIELGGLQFLLPVRLGTFLRHNLTVLEDNLQEGNA